MRFKLSTKWTVGNVFKAADKASRVVMNRFGSFVRRTAMKSIRNAKKTSKPGEPPKGKTGKLRDLLLFQYDPKSRNDVIGPAKTNQVFFNGNGKPVTGTVPEVIEEGGSFYVME